MVGIHLAAFGIGHAQGLDGADHEAAMVAQILRADVGEVRDVEHAHPPAERFVERLPIRMPGLLERLRGLPADGSRRREPQHQRPVLFDPRVARHADRVRAQDRLTPAGRQPQADVGHVRQVGQRRGIVPAVAPQPLRAFGRAGDGLVGVLRPGDARFLEEAAQHVQRFALVLFEFHDSILLVRDHGPRFGSVSPCSAQVESSGWGTLSLTLPQRGRG